MIVQRVEIPEFPVLRGPEAMEALHGFIDELEEERGKELTDKQTNALIMIANGLISSIEAETRMVTPNKDIKEGRFVTQLKNAITKYIPERASFLRLR